MVDSLNDVQTNVDEQQVCGSSVSAMVVFASGVRSDENK